MPTWIGDLAVNLLAAVIGAVVVFVASPPVRVWAITRARMLKRTFHRTLHSRGITTRIGKGERVRNVAVLLSGQEPYLVDLEYSFFVEAQKLLESHGVLLHVVRHVGSHNATLDDNNEVVSRINEQFKPDVLVTLGSGISAFVRRYYPALPQIFIGVTDPIRSGLCTHFGVDSARGPVSGVTFSVTAEDRLHFLREVIGPCRIGFVYRPLDDADEHQLAATTEALANIASARGMRIVPIPMTEPTLSPELLKDIDVLMGWRFQHANLPALLRQSPVPIIGGGWVDLRMGALCCLADDERQMGRLAARSILYDYVINRVQLCDIPILRLTGKSHKRLLQGVNLTAAGRFKVSIPTKVINAARYVIMEDSQQ